MPLGTQDSWIGIYRKKQAFWTHDDNPKRPHALLTSGMHSNGFFNSEFVMEDSALLDDVCWDLIELLQNSGLSMEKVDRVVGPAMGAITLAHDMSRKVNESRSGGCFRSYTEKEIVDGKNVMVFKRTRVISGEKTLLVEDVLTTGGSIELTADAVLRAGGIVLPFITVLVNRSGLKEVNGKKIVALIEASMKNWFPEECPLCAKGSKAIRPKGDNWTLLNADYS